MASSFQLRTFLIFAIFINSAQACHLGYNIIGIQARQSDKYEITCAQRALPICPKVCTWTNQTCEEYATRRHWNKTHLIVTNLTYSYPLKASGYPRNDIKGVKTKSLHRRCCLADNIEASKCKSIVWNVDQSKGKFDVLFTAEKILKCPTRNAYIRDIRQSKGIQRTFSLDICCMKYTKDHSARVACLAPKNGETQAGVDAAAAITLSVTLPMALGIGIPSLLGCGAQTIPMHNVGCKVRQVQVADISPDECCMLCVKQKFRGCEWNSAGYQQQGDCELCNGDYTLDPITQPVPGERWFSYILK